MKTLTMVLVAAVNGVITIQCNKLDTLQDKWLPSRAGKQNA